MAYVDNSYPPIGNTLQYRRGDGALVKIEITGPDGQPAQNLPATPAELAMATAADLTKLSQIAGTTIKLTDEVKAKIAATQNPVRDTELFDHPLIGGRFTVFVLLYGPVAYYEMHRRCLDAILATIPTSRLDLRIGSNELCHESVQYIEELLQSGRCTKHYRHLSNDRKYPVMREMFYDESCPITTKWLIWFDDDSIADANSNWLTALAQTIIPNYAQGGHMYGAKWLWKLSEAQREYYRGRPWYKGRPFRLSNGQPSPNGICSVFATGGFWALSTEAMRACDIPDPEILHNGGDYTIGEQLYQAGYNTIQFNQNKQYVRTSSVGRRGLEEPGFGSHEWRALKEAVDRENSHA